MCPQSAQGTSALPLLRALLQETRETLCRTEATSVSGAHRRVGVDRHAPRQHFHLLGRELVLLFLVAQTAIAAIACPKEIQKASVTSITPARDAVFNTSTATTACKDKSITQHACSDELILLASFSIHLQATMQNRQQGKEHGSSTVGWDQNGRTPCVGGGCVVESEGVVVSAGN